MELLQEILAAIRINLRCVLVRVLYGVGHVNFSLHLLNSSLLPFGLDEKKKKKIV